MSRSSIIGSEMTPIPDRPDRRGERLDHPTPRPLKPLGPDRIDLRLWDAGRPALCAALLTRPKDTIEKKADMLAAYTPAPASRGWEYALKEIREKGRGFPGQGISQPQSVTTRSRASKALLTFAFNAQHPGQRLGARSIRQCGRSRSRCMTS